MSVSVDPRKDLGPLLSYALAQVREFRNTEELFNIAAKVNADVRNGNEVLLPIVVKLSTVKPEVRESWLHYKDRVQDHLRPVARLVNEVMGQDPEYLFSANSLKTMASPEQIEALRREVKIHRMELDPLLQVVSMDDVRDDIGLDAFRGRYDPVFDGSGVKVAVLDSGVDTLHPYLKVHDSVSTASENALIPGYHGTHCAGIIASRDQFYPGVAPGVTLLNVKVLNSDGTGEPTNITRGIDAALDLGADVLSMSLGFNHLPSWSRGGHGWGCANGHCPLCTAVDNAVSLDQVVAVVAAGNEHEKAENLRNNGYGNEFDTELGCPGQARQAITVGAITKNTFLPAPFSSQGPTAYGSSKPDISAAGVNVWSTVPVPRKADGVPDSRASRSVLFRRDSGTSMATPVVAGVVALIIQKFRQQGIGTTVENIKNELFYRGFATLPYSQQMVGVGRVTLDQL